MFANPNETCSEAACIAALIRESGIGPAICDMRAVNHAALLGSDVDAPSWQLIAHPTIPAKLVVPAFLIPGEGRRVSLLEARMLL